MREDQVSEKRKRDATEMLVVYPHGSNLKDERDKRIEGQPCGHQKQRGDKLGESRQAAQRQVRKERSGIQKWHMLLVGASESRSSKTVHATGATSRHTNGGVNRCLIAFQASILRCDTM